MANSSVGLLIALGCRWFIDFATPPQREWGASLRRPKTPAGRALLLSNGIAPVGALWDHWLADGPEEPGAAEVGCRLVVHLVGLLVIGSTRANTVTGGRHRAGG